MDQIDFFHENGYVVFKKAIDESLIDQYNSAWEKENSNKTDQHGNNFGWDKESEHLEHPEVMDIMCNPIIANFFNELKLAVALHRVDTWSMSSEKPWHQDSIYSTPAAYNNYIGAWVAAEKVLTESGPFQLIPKSHKWSFDKHAVYLGENNGEIIDGRWFNYELEKQIEAHKEEEHFTFLAQKGDLLIWHGNLLHRALIPAEKNVTRKAIIGHYTNSMQYEDAIDEGYEKNMVSLLRDPNIKQWKNSGYYYDRRAESSI